MLPPPIDLMPVGPVMALCNVIIEIAAKRKIIEAERLKRIKARIMEMRCQCGHQVKIHEEEGHGRCTAHRCDCTGTVVAG